MGRNRDQSSDRRTSDEELDALLGTSKTPAEWVAAAEWWLAELGYALPEASPLFKALVAQVKLRGDDRAEVARLRAALEEIVSADPVDLVLDPTWAQRVACEALNGAEARKPESNGPNQGDWHDANIGGC